MNAKKYINLGKKLFPINRSLSGDGNLKTLKIIKSQIPYIKIKSFPSRKKVFDWIIPDEWNVKNAFVKDKYGKKIIDFKYRPNNTSYHYICKEDEWQSKFFQ